MELLFNKLINVICVPLSISKKDVSKTFCTVCAVEVL